MATLWHRCGERPADDAATIGGLSTAALEDLAEALMDFASPADLMAWLDDCRA